MRLFDPVIGWSVQNRVIVLLGACALAVGGVWMGAHAQLDALPDFTPPQVVVQTEARGMTALDVEELVTRPIERVLLGTPQVATVRSSSSPGLSVVTVVFENTVETYRARQLVTERLQLVAGRLPSLVAPPQLQPIAAPIGAVLKLCVTAADDSPEASRAARTWADWTVRPRLLAINGISQVMIHGGLVERFEVRPDLRKLQQFGVSLGAVQTALRESQALLGGGFIDNDTSRLDVQTDLRLTVEGAPEQLSRLLVSGGGSTQVRLADLATIVRASEPAVGAAIYDGKPAVYLQIMKLPWGDTPKVTAEVEAALEELRRTLPAGAVLQPPVFRQAEFIETSIRSVARSMLIGAALVIAILFVFLRSGRLAAISLTAIPLSVLAALATLVALGATINGMTLGGLAIAIGEVVDDAIVDVENVWRRLRENAASPAPRPPLEVIKDASREVRGSVVYATIIVCAVLIPVLMLGGIAGRIFSPLAQAYILAITASLLVALTVTPALCAVLLPRMATTDRGLPPISRLLLARYRRLLAKVVARPAPVLLLALGAGVVAMVVLPLLGGRFLPEFQERTLIAHVNAAAGTSLAESTRIAAQLDAQLRPGLASHTAARIGRAELGEDPFPAHRVEMDVVLKPDDDREPEERIAELAMAMGRISGINFSVEGFLGERVHEILAGETAPVVVKVIGPDLPTLRALAAQVAQTMQQTKGLGSVRVEPQVDLPQIRIRPDAGKLSRFGIRPLQLAEQVLLWRMGSSATQVLGGDGRVVDVVLTGPLEARSRAALLDLPLDAPGIGIVPLSAVAAVDDVPAPTVINHESGERRISIGAGAAGSSLSAAVRELQRRFTAMALPEGYRIETGGEAVARSAAATQLLLVGALVLLGIFMLLASAFSSVRDAAIVLLNFPLGLIGGVAGALLSPEGLSVAGLVGFVTLFGIIARNGIMLVAHKKQVDAERPGDDAIQRILLASEERLLPILMTAATAGLGLLPLALTYGSRGSELEAPMAIIVIGGLLSATLLNLLVLPTAYVWLESRRRSTPGAT